MSLNESTSAPILLPGEKIHFDHFEISWAGTNPLSGNLCFGSYDGRFRTHDKEGPANPACPSGEAINGIAFTAKAMAVSTRCDVGLIVFDDDGFGHRAVYEGGAHDVIATSSGGFVAPLGVHGILTMKPTTGPGQILATSRVDGIRANFYKFANLAVENGKDLIIGASRDDGLAIIELDSLEDRINPGRTSFLQSPGLDVVDVCSLHSPEWPRAAAWLNGDRTIFLSRDVLEDRPIRSLRLGETSGRAYSLLQEDGHFFLLTSAGFFMLPDLAARFLSGELDSRSTRVLAHHSRSIDEIFLAANSLLLSVDGDIYRTSMESIASEIDRSGWASSLEGSPELAEGSWEMTIGREWSSESKVEIAA